MWTRPRSSSTGRMPPRGTRWRSRHHRTAGTAPWGSRSRRRCSTGAVGSVWCRPDPVAVGGSEGHPRRRPGGTGVGGTSQPPLVVGGRGLGYRPEPDAGVGGQVGTELLYLYESHNCFSTILSKMRYCVYVLTCRVNGKQYVGETKNPVGRREDHLRIGPSREKQRQVIHAAVKKYGAENFTFEVVGEYPSRDEALHAEEVLIAEKKAVGIQLYNMNGGGRGGCDPSPETREKMSRTRKGKPLSQETKERISAEVKKKMATEEIKEKISEANRARWERMDDEVKKEKLEKMKQGRAGKPYVVSEEAREKISATLRQRADEKGRARDKIVDLVHNCPECGKEVWRKGVAGWKSQLKSGACKSCSTKKAHRTRSLKIEARVYTEECSVCKTPLERKRHKVSKERRCRSCRARIMWEKRRLKASPCGSSDQMQR